MKFERTKRLRLKSADAAMDIALINQLSKRELVPEDVYCFSLVMCDNDADREMERFTDEALRQMAPLFVGKTMLSDHRWSADRQIARIYRTEVVAPGEKNSLGEELLQLTASAYMLNTEENRHFIDAIEGGILREVSVGCSVGKSGCSLCGESFSIDWNTWKYTCPNGHVWGETYDEGLCLRQLEDIKDAYECSFVAVPAQPGAGVTKALGDVEAALETLLAADSGAFCSCQGKIPGVMKKLQMAVLDAAERKERAELAKWAESVK